MERYKGGSETSSTIPEMTLDIIAMVPYPVFSELRSRKALVGVLSTKCDLEGVECVA